ncbi:MAG: hypothetical protein ACI9Q4_002349, partial [Sediminicola sp.]
RYCIFHGSHYGFFNFFGFDIDFYAIVQNQEKKLKVKLVNLKKNTCELAI